jgi:hypothetical protein
MKNLLPIAAALSTFAVVPSFLGTLPHPPAGPELAFLMPHPPAGPELA